MHALIFCERPFVLSVLCMCFGAVVPTTPVVVTASACSTAVGRGLASRTMVMMVWLHSGQQYPSSWGMVTASASSSTTVGMWRPACGRCNVFCLYFWAAVPVAYAVVTASACSANACSWSGALRHISRHSFGGQRCPCIHGLRKCLFRNRFGCGLASSCLLASSCVRVLCCCIVVFLFRLSKSHEVY